MKGKYLKSVLLALTVTLATSVATAQDLGVVLGYRSDSADSDNALMTSMSSVGNIQGGLVAKFPLGDGPIWIRSGMIYEQHTYSGTIAATGAYNLKASYFSVPAGLLYKFSDYGGVFAGAAIGLNLSNSCSNGNGSACTVAGFNSSPISIQLGGSFKIAPQFGFELYYEQTTSKIADGIKNPRAIAANVMITFD